MRGLSTPGAFLHTPHVCVYIYTHPISTLLTYSIAVTSATGLDRLGRFEGQLGWTQLRHFLGQLLDESVLR